MDEAPGTEAGGPPGDLGISPPNAEPGAARWILVAHNRNVLKGWEWLCRNTPEDAQPCYAWLSQHATLPKPRRCYALKGKQFAGCWGYEIGSANRVYYKPDETDRKAVIFYAGPHPSGVPTPPKGL